MTWKETSYAFSDVIRETVFDGLLGSYEIFLWLNANEIKTMHRINFWISPGWNFSLSQDSFRRNCWNRHPVSHEGNAAVAYIISKKCLYWKFQKVLEKMPAVKHLPITLVHWDCNLAETNPDARLFIGKVLRWLFSQTLIYGCSSEPLSSIGNLNFHIFIELSNFQCIIAIV